MFHTTTHNRTTTLLLAVSAMLLFALLCPTTLTAQTSKRAVIEAMNRANNYFMLRYPDPHQGIDYPSRNTVYQSNIWTRGVYYEGVMALYSVTNDERCLNYALDWANGWNWELRRGATTRNADNQCCGQTYIMLYQIDPQPQRIAQIKLSVETMLSESKIDDWSWIDALQMAMPVFVQLGVVTDNEACFERAYQMYSYTKNRHGQNGLFNPVDGLWWRDGEFDTPYCEPNGKNCYWSRGNGWVLAAMVRVLEFLPRESPHREEYEAMVETMCRALVPLQRKDGFWNVSLHDPDHYSGPETTGTALFVYAMAWGINNGILDAKLYRPTVVKGWKALCRKALHSDGSLGYVQGTGKEPKDGQPVTRNSVPDFEDYGLGCFLLAGSQVCEMK